MYACAIGGSSSRVYKNASRSLDELTSGSHLTIGRALAHIQHIIPNWIIGLLADSEGVSDSRAAICKENLPDMIQIRNNLPMTDENLFAKLKGARERSSAKKPRKSDSTRAPVPSGAPMETSPGEVIYFSLRW